MSTELHRWRKGATTDEWAQLAKLANTTPGYLDQIAYGNRRASPEMASATARSCTNGIFQECRNSPAMRRVLMVWGRVGV